jgi:hypothetical protein
MQAYERDHDARTIAHIPCLYFSLGWIPTRASYAYDTTLIGRDVQKVLRTHDTNPKSRSVPPRMVTLGLSVESSKLSSFLHKACANPKYLCGSCRHTCGLHHLRSLTVTHKDNTHINIVIRRHWEVITQSDHWTTLVRFLRDHHWICGNMKEAIRPRWFSPVKTS